MNSTNISKTGKLHYTRYNALDCFDKNLKSNQMVMSEIYGNTVRYR